MENKQVISKKGNLVDQSNPLIQITPKKKDKIDREEQSTRRTGVFLLYLDSIRKTSFGKYDRNRYKS